ncbi:MAG: ferrochelatase [Verrucomicrobiales bacterium]|nr:ferrochelatase [Verrucomicrobiales bacterium]
MSQDGVLLINLGSPDSTAVGDVRRYLREFLMDPRVLDVAWPIRALVVNAFILPKRPHQSAEAYEKIWTPEGSPLVVTSQHVRQALEAELRLPVELAMRYRLPSAKEALENLTQRGVRRAALIPLFPHFAMSSFETAVVHVMAEQKRWAPQLELRTAAPYFDEPNYIQALVDSASPSLQSGYDHLLFSFHGIPERHLRKSDPTGKHCLACANCCETPSPAHATCYKAQCLRTVAAFAAKSGIKRYSVAFQSRLGRDPWLRPYTDYEIPRLAKEGVRRLRVICPAFVSDCLETIEEIGMRGRELFLEAGGTDFELIPCLNEHPAWIQALAGIAQKTLG